MAATKIPPKSRFEPLVPHGYTISVVRVPEGTDTEVAAKAIEWAKKRSAKMSKGWQG